MRQARLANRPPCLSVCLFYGLFPFPFSHLPAASTRRMSKLLHEKRRLRTFHFDIALSLSPSLSLALSLSDLSLLRREMQPGNGQN